MSNTTNSINERVEKLREYLRRNGLCAFIFPSTDPHQGEYVPEHWQTRKWISGFDGSAGAGFVADIKTMAHFGVYGQAVCTAHAEMRHQIGRAHV